MSNIGSRPRVLIAIATYRREEQLVRLLRSLETTCATEAHILVVDNDPDCSARSVVARFPPVQYENEPEPGIAAARNRGLHHFNSEYEFIVFVDDDEWVGGDWLTTLIATAQRLSVDVVQGPVVPVLPPTAPAWVTNGRFFERVRYPTGTPLPSAATNNTLLRRAAWERSGHHLFDPLFSLSGGSDWDFFWRIRKDGASIVFSDEATVFEEVPPSRISFRWLRRRATRKGIVRIRVLRKHREPLTTATIRSIARLVFSGGALGLVALYRRRIDAKRFEAFFQEVGFLSGSFGYRIEEYRRHPGG